MNQYQTPPQNEDATEATSRRSEILDFLLLGFLVTLLVLATAFYVLARPAVDRSLLAKINPGMTQQQVTSILGQPNRKFENSQQWSYWRWGNAGWVEIKFDEDGCVDYVNDESAFP